MSIFQDYGRTVLYTAMLTPVPYHWPSWFLAYGTGHSNFIPYYTCRYMAVAVYGTANIERVAIPDQGVITPSTALPLEDSDYLLSERPVLWISSSRRLSEPSGRGSATAPMGLVREKRRFTRKPLMKTH